MLVAPQSEKLSLAALTISILCNDGLAIDHRRSIPKPRRFSEMSTLGAPFLIRRTCTLPRSRSISAQRNEQTSAAVPEI